jgi:hypothetical protein
MIPPASSKKSSRHHSGPAILLLNGEPVGTVRTRGWETSWGFGDFCPNEAFSYYAPVYGMWSLLMHADDETIALSRDAIEELNKAEELLARIKAQLLFTDDQHRIDVAELTIDGDQLEWKEY